MCVVQCSMLTIQERGRRKERGEKSIKGRLPHIRMDRYIQPEYVAERHHVSSFASGWKHDELQQHSDFSRTTRPGKERARERETRGALCVDKVTKRNNQHNDELGQAGR